MSAKTGAAVYRLDSLKWLLVVLLVAAGVWANSYFSDQVALLYRVLGLVVGGVLVAFVAVNTAKGAAFWGLVKESQLEVRKVVWPTREETNQTTLIVVAVVFVMALILWGLDTFLGWIASLIIG